MTFCRELRQSGRVIFPAIDYETYHREKYDDVEGVLESLDAYLSLKLQNYHTKLAYLRRGIVGVKYGRPELYKEVDIALLPSPQEADAQSGRLAVTLLKTAGLLREAIEYAYEILRLNFSEHHAHQAFVESIGPLNNLSELPTYSTVQLGCAVKYEAVVGSAAGWIILEDAQNPQFERGEFSPVHPAVVDLIGKAIGDEFTLRTSSVEPTMAKILQIASKFAFRYVDILDEWQIRFPDIPFAEKHEAPLDANGQPDPTGLINALDKQAKQVEQLHDYYRTHRISVVGFSNVSGFDVLDSVAHLSSAENLPIRCSFGDDKELNAAEAAIDGAREMVLCPSALATLWHVRAWEYITQLPFKLVLSRGTYELLRRKPEEIAIKYDDLGEESLIAHQNSLMAFQEWIKSHCEIVSGLALADLEPQVRDKLERSVGDATSQSLAVARSRSCVLWTDDLGVSELQKSGLEFSGLGARSCSADWR
jgi:transcription elongation GreA/GreB family factor